MIRAVALDMDGTLLLGLREGVGAGNRAAAHYLKRYGIPEAAGEAAMRRAYTYTTTAAPGGFVVSKREQFAVAAVLAGLRYDDAMLDGMYGAFLEATLPLRRLDPEFLPAVAALQGAAPGGLGLRVGVQTSAPSDVATPELRHVGVLDKVDFLVTSDRVQAGKGTLTFSRAVLEAAGCRPEELVIVGDEEADLVAARVIGAVAVRIERPGEGTAADVPLSAAAGSRKAAVPASPQPLPPLEPDHVIRSLAELPALVRRL